MPRPDIEHHKKLFREINPDNSSNATLRGNYKVCYEFSLDSIEYIEQLESVINQAREVINKQNDVADNMLATLGKLDELESKMIDLNPEFSKAVDKHFF